MPQKDMAEKTLLAHNDVFADVVNALLFGGKERVKPDELTDAQSQSAFKADGGLHGQERDVAKFWNRREIRIAFFGLENQTEIDRTMPIRVMSYDGAAYKAQLFGKTQAADGRPPPLHPVVTLVLYLGYKRRWKRPRSLYETMAVPDELKPFTSDYKINIFEIAFLEKDDIMKFKSDFRFLAEYLYQMRTVRDYRPSAEEMTYVGEVLQMMEALTGNERIVELYAEQMQKATRRIKTMEDVFTRAENRGIAIGEERGRTEGIAEGEERKAFDAARNLKRLGVSEEIIAQATGLSREKVAAL